MAARERAPGKSGAGRGVGVDRGAGPGHWQGRPASDALGACGRAHPSGSLLTQLNHGGMGQNYSEGPSPAQTAEREGMAS